MLALSLGVALAFAPTLTAQPEIEHEDAGCIPRGEFTRFTASVHPLSAIRAIKLYFRSSFYREFYFVPMSPNEAGAFEAVMPMPSDETTKVVYYFEAVDLSFQTSRSAELEVSVSDDSGCRRGPGAAVFPGGNPAIVVGAAQAGAPAIPVGFQATGITGFLSAAGVVSSTGGGIGLAVAVVAAAGAAAGVGVLVSNGGAVTTTATPQGGGNTTSTSSASTSATTSSGPSTSSISATTTSSTGGGSTTTSTGPSTSSIPAPTLTACFTWQALGNCRVFFDSCSTPESSVARYEWRMLGPPVPEPPQVESFAFSFEADPRCRGTMIFNHPVRLTVHDEFGGSASVQQNVSVRSGATSRTDDGASAILYFRSLLATLPPLESARGQIVVNGIRLAPSSGASTRTHEMRVPAGIVQIEVALLTEVTPGSLWELDFSSSESVIPGSLRPESGAVASADQRRIVFRLNGDRGETFRLRLEAR